MKCSTFRAQATLKGPRGVLTRCGRAHSHSVRVPLAQGRLALVAVVVLLALATVPVQAAAPVVAFPGASPAPINDDQTNSPLQAITITDADDTNDVTVRITLPADRGTFPIGAGLT